MTEHACEASDVDRHILVELESDLPHAQRAAIWYAIQQVTGVLCLQALRLDDIRPDRLWVFDPIYPPPRVRTK